MGFHQKGVALLDLPPIRQAYEQHSHHYYLSAVEHRKDTRDLVEGFQRITSDEKLLSSCAVFPTVTSPITTTTISTSGPYL